MNVFTVLGTRPEAIKLAPVIHEVQRRAGMRNTICVTGQHRELLDPFLGLFELEPDINLNVMQPNQTLASLSARIMQGVDWVLEAQRPDVVLVQGDTTTVMAAALAAFYRKVPVGHVEAGLRSGDRFNPFPEELNRCLADQLSDYLFAPTQRARTYLLKEGFSTERIFVTGNTVIDALLWVVQRLPKHPDPTWALPRLDPDRRLILVTGHRRESFGAGFEQICLGLRDVVQAHPDVEIVYPVHLNPQVRGPVTERLGGFKRIHLLPPLGYRPFVYLMKRAHLILTDSGGVQEEAPALGTPTLVMRRVSERPEGVEAGVAKLIGTDANVMLREVTRLLNDADAHRRMARALNPYGDGHAAQRIVDTLLGVS